MSKDIPFFGGGGTSRALYLLRLVERINITQKSIKRKEKMEF